MANGKNYKKRESMFDCLKNMFVGHKASSCEGLVELPLLRYQKEPVEYLHELYGRYADGGEYGWYALVVSEGRFAYWDKGTKKWLYVNGSGTSSDGCCQHIDGGNADG